MHVRLDHKCSASYYHKLYFRRCLSLDSPDPNKHHNLCTPISFCPYISTILFLKLLLLTLIVGTISLLRSRKEFPRMVQAMPETSHWYCLPLQSSKAYRDHSKTLVNSEVCHGCHWEIWGSRIGVNEESSLLGRETPKRLWVSRVFLRVYINTNVWVNWTDGDMRRYVGARTVPGRGTCVWSRCMVPGSMTLAALRDQHMWTILLRVQSESRCIFLDVFLSFFSLILLLIYTSKSLFSRACLLRNPTQPFLF